MGGGLQLRVKPNGSKLWLLDYCRPFTKVRTSLSFGLYPDVTLAEARKKREEARRLLAKEVDPKDHRDEVNRIKESAYSNDRKGGGLTKLQNPPIMGVMER